MENDIYAPNVSYSPKPPSRNFISNLGYHFVDLIQTFVVVGAIFAITYLFIAQPNKVSGNSMVPNFHDGDYILTEKITYKFGEPQKGDTIVLKNPRNTEQDFIKRVIGTPSDTIAVQNDSVYINGQKINESYLPRGTETEGGKFLREGESLRIGINLYFALGDNRGASSDSREWGPVTKDNIIGKVFLRYWPPKDFGLITHP